MLRENIRSTVSNVECFGCSSKLTPSEVGCVLEDNSNKYQDSVKIV